MKMHRRFLLLAVVVGAAGIAVRTLRRGWFGALTLRLWHGGGAEQSAERFLAVLGTEQCHRNVLAMGTSPEEAQDLCVHENKHLMLRWTFASWKEHEGGIRLKYYFEDAELKLEGDLFVGLRRNNGSWKVVGYSRGY